MSIPVVQLRTPDNETARRLGMVRLRNIFVSDNFIYAAMFQLTYDSIYVGSENDYYEFIDEDLIYDPPSFDLQSALREILLAHIRSFDRCCLRRVG